MLQDGAADPQASSDTTTTTISKVQFNPVKYNLPTLLSADVPKCGASAFDVRKYFQDVEEVGRNLSMPAGEIIGMAFYYAGNDNRLLWKTFRSHTSDDWLQFKGDISKLYPDAFYRVDDLVRCANIDGVDPTRGLIKEGEFDSIEDLRRYFIRFLRIVNDVRPYLNPSAGELCFSFLSGLPRWIRALIFAELVPLRDNDTQYSFEFLLERVLDIWLKEERRVRDDSTILLKRLLVTKKWKYFV